MLPLVLRVAYTRQQKWRAAPGAARHGSPPTVADFRGEA
jgi:hypothetical protein